MISKLYIVDCAKTPKHAFLKLSHCIKSHNKNHKVYGENGVREQHAKTSSVAHVLKGRNIITIVA